MEVVFSGDVFEWRGPSPYYYVAVPDDDSADIKEASPMLTYGWGVIPARVTVGDTVWETSLFPKDGRYLVPLKDAVRRAEAIGEGDLDRRPHGPRRPVVTIEVHPATHARFGDVATMVGPKRPDANVCWCLSHRIDAKTNRELTGTDRGAYVEELTRRPVSPGVLAYDGDEVVGWAAVAPRSELPFARSAKIPHVDDLPVWSVWCLRVRPGHRGQGISHALLRGAVDYAREQGAPAVEGYPADNGDAKVDLTMAYVGTRRLFEAAGFTLASRDRRGVGRLPAGADAPGPAVSRAARVTPTPEEVARPLPGDDLVPDATTVMDRAFTLPAPPEEVWPWLVQLGKRRAGWYLPWSVERWLPPSRRALRHLDPRWQGLAVGDVIPDWGGRDETFTVTLLRPAARAGAHLAARPDRRQLGAVPRGDGAARPGCSCGCGSARSGHPRLVGTLGEAFDWLTIRGLAAGLAERLGRLPLQAGVRRRPTRGPASTSPTGPAAVSSSSVAAANWAA